MLLMGYVTSGRKILGELTRIIFVGRWYFAPNCHATASNLTGVKFDVAAKATPDDSD
ncbi:hypothetical protein KCP78_15590 [Salmonella enterica subsp. enterica]|nr:hypothetical protein KCP78_15590 [Salmonella enterica subsp. enterica]